MSRYYRHNPEEPIQHDWFVQGQRVKIQENMTKQQAIFQLWYSFGVRAEHLMQKVTKIEISEVFDEHGWIEKPLEFLELQEAIREVLILHSQAKAQYLKEYPDE